MAAVSQGFGPHTREQWLALTEPQLQRDGEMLKPRSDPSIALAFKAVGLAMGPVILAWKLMGVAVALLASPLAWVALAITGLIAAFATWTKTGQKMATAARGFFADIFESAKITFDGVADALLSGNIETAAKILWVGIKIEFLKGKDAVLQSIKDLVTAVYAAFVATFADVTNLWRSFMANLPKPLKILGGIPNFSPEAWTKPGGNPLLGGGAIPPKEAPADPKAEAANRAKESQRIADAANAKAASAQRDFDAAEKDNLEKTQRLEQLRAIREQHKRMFPEDDKAVLDAAEAQRLAFQKQKQLQAELIEANRAKMATEEAAARDAKLAPPADTSASDAAKASGDEIARVIKDNLGEANPEIARLKAERANLIAQAKAANGPANRPGVKDLKEFDLSGKTGQAPIGTFNALAAGGFGGGDTQKKIEANTASTAGILRKLYDKISASPGMTYG